MDWIHINNIGNLPDWRTGFGSVPYAYDIAKYQLSNTDWSRFLLAIGMENARRLKLWHKDMASGVLGGIDENGVAKSGWEKKPVVYVNYESLCRYCNWLSSGNTESGSYDMNGEAPRRIKGAKYVIPTINEWYKATYYDGKRYANYPTGDKLPTLRQANYQRGDEFSVGAPYYLADVDAYSDYASPWGVVQMGGNAWEFLEDLRTDKNGMRLNTLKGGSFGYTETGLSKFNTDVVQYNSRCYVFGARIGYFENGWHPCQSVSPCLVRRLSWRIGNAIIARVRV